MTIAMMAVILSMTVPLWLFIAVVVPYPGHGEGQPGLVAALRHGVEQIVTPEQRLGAARKGGVGMEDLAVPVLVEHADAWRLLARKPVRAVVVVDVALGDLFRRERDVIVVVEVAPVGRDPREAPAHALAEHLDLRRRRTRYHDERHVAG